MDVGHPLHPVRAGVRGAVDHLLLRELHEVWTPPRPASEDVAKRILAVAKVAYRHEPSNDKAPTVRPFEPGVMGRVSEDVGDSWQQWTTGK